jgi:beta-galactosidase
VILGTESFPRAAYPSWRPVEQFPYVIGDFVWTGMDHLGESSIGNAQLNSPGRAPGGGGASAAQGPPAPGTFGAMMAGGSSSISLPFPWFNCYCGDIDLIGQPKAQWFHRRVIWGLSALEMAVQRPVPAGRTEVVSPWGWSDELRSWTWPGNEGKTLKVRVYSSGDQVRLLLNGKEVGVKPVSPETERRPVRCHGPNRRCHVVGRQILELHSRPWDGGETATDSGSGLDPAGPERLSYVTVEWSIRRANWCRTPWFQ